MEIDWDNIRETAIEKKQIEEALKDGPIPVPTSEMKPGDWTPVKVFAVLVNPIYTGIGPYPQIIDDDLWIKAVASHIERLGAHLTLRVLLDSLRQALG